MGNNRVFPQPMRIIHGHMRQMNVRRYRSVVEILSRMVEPAVLVSRKRITPRNKRGPVSNRASFISGVPKEIRTPVAAVKGQCPRPLDDGDKTLNGMGTDFKSVPILSLVELAGIEPATSCMPCKRSPS